MKKIIALVVVISLGLAIPLRWVYAQKGTIESRILVDTPTAGTLERGSFDFLLRLYPNGGLITGVAVGLTPRLMFGITYGGENIIGEGKINWNPAPGINARYRVIEETYASPALTLGFDSQGYGAYIDSTKRYTIKSRGFFVVASKNYAFLGDLGLHGGVNYSLEKEDGDSDLNLFVGASKDLNPELTLIAEYDFAVNDNSDNSLGSGKGYLNAGVRWTFANRLFLELDLKNILKNKQNLPYSNREIKIMYVEHF